MSIDLFKHNLDAYNAVVSMLAETGKAAVVHPTGTGKSFIGFKLAEDNSDRTICWLSPSEYIFKTQLENLAATGADVPENIAFYTYAKLMLMSNEEIAEIQPDYIVLDEFHRCGAEMWGKGVQNILNQYPDAQIIGLSATNIRYLDNQRDMAEELFDGNVASEMTLGEAIVRGILNPPTYVISVYSYQKDLEKYKSRIKRAKNKAARDAAERYFDELRRALDKADGLDAIFEKHMADKVGKYIVFCANIEHMDEMVSRVPEWFGKIDRKPHIYRAYSDNPETSQAFSDFKADDSEHLKLLFCIDMLNEGVHVDDVSGVVLFRPTVSPIIYKQQIGRALSASKRKSPIIFDVVNNFENLYSIGAIEQEMRAAITYYRFLDDGKEIVTDHFNIIDEVRNCRELFDSMNDALTASWDLMYSCAKQYFTEHGNLDVPRRFRTENGYSLGTWLQTQRLVRSGETFGRLDDNRIQKLDAIGMRWGSYRDIAWEKNYEAARQYYEQHGNLNTNLNDLAPSGLALGRWICQMRVYRKNRIQGNYLTDERIRALDALGMIWDVPDYLWENNFAEAMSYYRTYGNLDVPHRYTSPNGIKLGIWIRNVRGIRAGLVKGARALTDDQIGRLDSIGMLWEDKFTRLWNQSFCEAKAFFDSHGDLNVPATYITDSGFKLGDWIANQRESAKRISSERREKLDSIGMLWEKPNSWEVRYALAKSYFNEHGNLDVPPDYVAEGVWLSKWLNEQRHIILGNRKGKALTDAQLQRLTSIGFTVKTKAEQLWDEYYEDAHSFYNEHGHLQVPAGCLCQNGKSLSRWIQVQRDYYKRNKLTEMQISKLTEIGMLWTLDDPWESGYEHAQKYYEQFSNLSVPSSYICDDGYRLGTWIANQRNDHNSPKKYHSVSREQAERLEQIGMIWNPAEVKWNTSYLRAVEFFNDHGNLKLPPRYRTAENYDLGDWLRQQREKYWNNQLTEDQISKLNAIAMDWLTSAERKWEKAYALAEKYYRTQGNLNVPSTYKDKSGFGVGTWVRNQKASRAGLTPNNGNGDRIKRLEAIGMKWTDEQGE